MAVLVPLWIPVLWIGGVVGMVVWVTTDVIMGWIDPKIKGWLIRRFEKKTGTKWDPEWDEMWKRK